MNTTPLPTLFLTVSNSIPPGENPAGSFSYTFPGSFGLCESAGPSHKRAAQSGLEEISMSDTDTSMTDTYHSLSDVGGISSDETTQPINTKKFLQANNEPIEENSFRSQKRLAVYNPDRRTLEHLRDEIKYSRDLHAVSSARLKSDNQRLKQNVTQLHSELRRVQGRLSDAVALNEKFGKRITENEANEIQMAEHIVQAEKENERLCHEKLSLNQRVVELDTAIKSDREKYKNQERQLAERENEAFALRQRLLRMPASTVPEVPPGNLAGATSPTTYASPSGATNFQSSEPIASGSSYATQYSRRIPGKFRHAAVLPNSEINLGTVPLVPRVPADSPPPTLSFGNASGINPRKSQLPTSCPAALPVESIELVVQETLRQMGIGGSPERASENVPSRYPHSKKTSRIRQQQSRMSKIDDLNWKTTIREEWRKTYGIETAKAFCGYHPASSSDVEAVENGANLEEDIVQLNFGSGYERSRWNRIVLQRLCRRILDERDNDGGWGLPNVSEDYVLGILSGHLKRSHDGWAVRRPRFLPDAARMETNSEVQQRNNQNTTFQSAAVACRSRRKAKLDRRKDIVTTVAGLKAHSGASDLDTWYYFERMLHLLDVDGMSEEEASTYTVNGQVVPVFRVKLCPWRANQITQYVRIIDQMGTNPAFQSSRGNRPSPRIPSIDPGTSLRIGLPLKMYHPEWLDEMKKGRPNFATDILEVSEESFEYLELSTHSDFPVSG